MEKQPNQTAAAQYNRSCASELSAARRVIMGALNDLRCGAVINAEIKLANHAKKVLAVE